MDGASCTWNLRIGAPVYTADGQELGTVVSTSTHVLVVERGRWFKSGYVFRPQEIGHVADGAIHLTLTMGEVESRTLTG